MMGIQEQQHEEEQVQHEAQKQQEQEKQEQEQEQQPYKPKPPNMSPIAPVTPDDCRPSVRDLLLEHVNPIQEMKELIKSNPLYNLKLHDDLWLLRFWLSSRNVKRAVKHAIEAMEYRELHKLDERDIRVTMWPLWDVCSNNNDEKEVSPKEYIHLCSLMEKYSIVHCQLHPDRGLISFVKISGLRPDEQYEGVTEEEDIYTKRLWTEWRFQVLDEITRRTGRLTKHITVADMTDVSLKHFDRRAAKRNGRVNKITSFLYPQDNGGVFLFNAPSIFRNAWRILRLFFPKRLSDKVDLIATKEDICQIYPKFVNIDSVSNCFGGNDPNWPPTSMGIQYHS